MQCNTNRMRLTATWNYEILSLVFKAELHMSLFMQTQAQMGEGANHLENNVQGFFVLKYANQQPHSSSQTPKGLF